MSPLLAAALCFVLSLAMHLPWLAITPIAGTEGHRIFPAHAMVKTHWWLVPTLFDKPFMTKPPLHHWLIAMSEMSSGGGNAFDVGGPKALFFWRLPSAVTGALLCSAVCWFGARWFGRRAGLISGLCAVGMITLWGQSQVADIDSTNTLATVLTALCGVEVFLADHNSHARWMIAATLAMTAMLMTKGPAGLPIVLGVWLWPLIWPFIQRRLKPHTSESAVSQSPIAHHLVVSWLIPFAISLSAFGAWWLLAKHSLRMHGMQFDTRGLHEGTSRLYVKSFRVLFESIFFMLPQVVLFGLPTTFAVPLYFIADVRRAMETRQRRIARMLVGATAISWIICVISGMTNPRYAYPTLMLLCPLAGAVAVAAVKTRHAADWLRGFAMISAIAFAGATVGLSIGARRAVDYRLLLIASSIFALVTAWIIIVRLPRDLAAARGFVALILFASIPFGIQRHWARTLDSALNDAPHIREVTGENASIALCGAATSKPEAFYYARVRPDFIPLYDFFPKTVKRGTWIMLDQAEHKRWLKQPDSRLENDRKICKWGQTDYYLAWYPK